MVSNPENINTFRSLFKGREDVFAVRWEKGNKSSYMPAVFYDPYRFRAHKINGGTFQNFNKKSYLKLTDDTSQKAIGEFLNTEISKMTKMDEKSLRSLLYKAIKLGIKVAEKNKDGDDLNCGGKVFVKSIK